MVVLLVCREGLQLEVALRKNPACAFGCAFSLVNTTIQISLLVNGQQELAYGGCQRYLPPSSKHAWFKTPGFWGFWCSSLPKYCHKYVSFVVESKHRLKRGKTRLQWLLFKPSWHQKHTLLRG